MVSLCNELISVSQSYILRIGLLKVYSRWYTTPSRHSRMSGEQRQKLSSGPDLTDFISGNVVAEDTQQSYKGQLKKEGKERLRLPPWLKTEIPIGRNYAKLKKSLRNLKLNTVRFVRRLAVQISESAGVEANMILPLQLLC